MLPLVPIGKQNFVMLRDDNYFYIDKTKFIRDWWNGGDDVTLITRPRRFGKTLMLDTVKTFFAPEFKDRSDLFDGLEIWQDEKFRNLQGTIPVIFLSFADIKESSYTNMLCVIKEILCDIYRYYTRLLDPVTFSDWEKKLFSSMNEDMSEIAAKRSLRNLSECLYYRYKQKPIILLDEYDTPLQEAWLEGYWDQLVEFMRGFFNSTFKTNRYLNHALITGITRVAKESIFSDFNNLKVVTTTTDIYTDCFGFTEQEVFATMDEYGLTEKQEVKRWYDGFIFGSQKEIYNPWSIIGYLSEKKFAPYWADTSSNNLIGELIAHSDIEVMEATEKLLLGEAIETKLDEQLVFSQLYDNDEAIWSLLMAA